MHQTSRLENPQAKRIFTALRPPRWLRIRQGWRNAILVVLLLAAAVELVGRHLGLHTPVLYETTEYGFRPRPNQQIRRFGNLIEYDANGLRSAPVAALPPAGTLRLLFIGDSIVNGGARTDQTRTIPYLVRGDMTQAARPVEVLSASSPGWALANAAGWFNRYGTFGSRYVVLVTNTYDLFQQQAGGNVVGSHPAFPATGPGLALVEVALRYLWPRLAAVEEFQDPGADMRSAAPNLMRQVLGDLRWLLLRARSQGAVAVVVLVEPVIPLTPAAQALSDGALRALRQELDSLATPMIDTRLAIDGAGGAALFRDGLHPTEDGNAIIARTIAAGLERLDAGSR